MKKNKLVNPSEIQQSEHSNRSAAQRGVDAGLSPKNIGLVKNEAKRIAREKKQHVPVMFYNQTAAVVFVAFGDKDVAVPSISDGLPVLPGEKCVYNGGESEFVISSSAVGIYAYTANDNE